MLAVYLTQEGIWLCWQSTKTEVSVYGEEALKIPDTAL